MPEADVLREQRQSFKGVYIGEVKNVDDPLKAGRIQVKLFGLFDHIEDKDLPWARPIMLPIGGAFGDTELQNGQISRDCDTDIGSFMVPNLGAHVICLIPNENPNLIFYMGVIPGLKEYDTNKQVDLHTTSIKKPYYKLNNECTFDNPPLQIPKCTKIISGDGGKLHLPVWNKRTWPMFNAQMMFDEKSAYVAAMRFQGRVCLEKSFETEWAEDEDFYMQSKYPHRKILTFSETKVLIEWDDTKGNETIHFFHPSGTFIEINKNGNILIHSENETFDIVKKNKKICIKGNKIETIWKNKELRVKGKILSIIETDREIQVVKNDINRIEGDKILRVHNEWNVKVCEGSAIFNIKINWISNVGKLIKFSTETINFNASKVQRYIAPKSYIGANGRSWGGVCTTADVCRYTGGSHPGSSTVFATK